MGNTDALSTPDWVQDAVFYQIFPDRFAQSNSVAKPSNLEPWDSPPTQLGFKGGDLLGIVEHLDYLEDLGVTALYLNPIFMSTANHRYHTYDYHHVDPILGGDHGFSYLLDEAHRREMRVVLDGVFNHASRGFYQFNHLLENGPQSPYLDWFTVESWPLHPYGPPDQPSGYAAWWGLPALPKFNVDAPDVRAFLLSVGEHWAQQGIDGWRLDVPNEIDDDEFWRDFRRRVRQASPHAYLVGEIWGDASRWLKGDQFDGVMNYLFTRSCLGFFAGTGQGVDQESLERTGLSHIVQLDAPAFRDSVERLVHLYPQAAVRSQLNLIDSHDTPRYLTAACGDESSLRLALLFQMTFVGAPCVYYGDEIGMTGGPDPDCRGAFPWDTARWNESLRAYFRDCIALRREHTALRRGTFSTLHAEDSLYIFERALDDHVLLVGLNCGLGAASVPLATLPGLGDAKIVFGDGDLTLENGEVVRWEVPARSGVVIEGAARHA